MVAACFPDGADPKGAITGRSFCSSYEAPRASPGAPRPDPIGQPAPRTGAQDRVGLSNLVGLLDGAPATAPTPAPRLRRPRRRSCGWRIVVRCAARVGREASVLRAAEAVM
jgi:hypothetical protein